MGVCTMLMTVAPLVVGYQYQVPLIINIPYCLLYYVLCHNFLHSNFLSNLSPIIIVSLIYSLLFQTLLVICSIMGLFDGCFVTLLGSYHLLNLYYEHGKYKIINN